MNGQLLGLYAETPIHAGGAAAAGAIDLTIQRNVATGLPVIWGHSLKGALKANLRGRNRANGNRHEDATNEVTRLFGGDPGSEGPPGKLGVVGARLVAFPVPCFTTMMAWITSPAMLDGVARLASICGLATPPPVTSRNHAVPSNPKSWPKKELFLGLSAFTVETDDAAIDAARRWSEWIGTHLLPQSAPLAPSRQRLADFLVVVPDAPAVDLTREYAHIVTRNQLNESKTVDNLFTEECLPTDTVLVSMVLAHDDTNIARQLHHLASAPILLGGSTTVGHGLAWTTFGSTGAEHGQAGTEDSEGSEGRS